MKILRNTVFFILTAIILLSTVTCVEPDEPDDKVIDNSIKYLPVHFNTLNVTGEQVWMPNYNTGKVSQMLLKFTGDRDVDLIVIDYTSYLYPYFKTVGSGNIDKGILDFSVDMDDDDLLDSDDLLYFYFNEWYEDGDITMEPEAKGNIITLVTLYNNEDKETPGTIPVEAIIREGFSGTNNSFTGEYIYYLYADADCTISAGKVERTELKYTFNEFELSLKAGWNTICKSETYTTTGDSSYSIKVLNPDIRWVMQKIK
jgi:hypothetical protein